MVLKMLLLFGAVIWAPCVNGIFFPRAQVDDHFDLKSHYDFIVIGSGAAGAAIANRLSENKNWNILLLEIGKRSTFLSEVPMMAAYTQFTEYNWAYLMEKTPGICLGFDKQRCTWPRGRGLGGTTLINYMIYTRGNKLDYDRWAAAGNPGWSYDQVLPYFKKAENAHIKIHDEGYHGYTGPLSVEDVPFRSAVSHVFIQAGKELGYDYVDYNGRTQDGFSYVQANTKNGRRWGADKAYINPIEGRVNLDISMESRVTKLLIDQSTKEAYGVEFLRNGRYYYVNATKEVIVSAGALSSPQLLMLSGIGPKKHLQRIGINVIQDLPVGRYLQDHITFLGLLFELNAPIGLSEDDLTNPKNILAWALRGEGPLSSLGAVEGLGYIHTNITNNPSPDIEYIFLAGTLNADGQQAFRKMFGVNDEIYYKLFHPYERKPVWTVLPMLTHPKSIGHMELKSPSPFHYPRFYGNYFSDKENIDIKTFIESIRQIQRLAKTKAFSQYSSRLSPIPIPGCESHKFDSDAYWECGLRTLTTTLHHQLGTCKMGPKGDKTAVVDNELRVHGIKRLRVADTSIIPVTLAAHLNAPAYMIGEKAADYIKAAWTSRKQ